MNYRFIVELHGELYENEDDARQDLLDELTGAYGDGFVKVESIPLPPPPFGALLANPERRDNGTMIYGQTGD